MKCKRNWFEGYGMNRLFKFSSIIAFLMASLFITNSYAEIQKRTIIGTPTTGMNRFFSDPIAIFPGDLGSFGFITVAEFNENGEVIPITGPLPDSTFIASFVDPEWASLSGFPPEILDTAKNNVPMREIPIRIDTGGINKEILTELKNLGQMDVGFLSPARSVTLGDWLRARGQFDITCVDNEFALVEGKFSGLFPNHVYTLREWYTPEATFPAVPGVFGGAPASFIADKYGNGEFRAKLPHCPPMSADDVDDPFFAIALTVTFGHELGGLFPVFPLSSDPSLPGERAFGQLFFPLTGERIVPGTGPASDIKDWSCKKVDMVESELLMASAIEPAIGPAKVVIDGEVKYPLTTIAFARLPKFQDDGTLTFLASITFEFGDNEILEGFMEGLFIPTAEDPNIVNNHSAARFVGGKGSFSPAVGEFPLRGVANFNTLIANITGKGEVCTPKDI